MSERHFHGTLHGTFNLDDLIQHEQTRESKLKIAREMLALCKREAAARPQDAERWNAKADEYQLQIDNLSVDIPAGWIEDNSNVFISRVGGVDLYADMDALKESNRQIKARYIASLRRQGVSGNKQADALEVTG